MTGERGDRELLEADPPRALNRGVLIGVVGVVVAMLIGFRLAGGGTDDFSTPSPSPTPSPVASSLRPTPTPTPSPTVGPAPEVVRRGTGPLAPGVPAGMLYLRSADALYAVDPATGTVVRTEGIEVGSSGPVALVPTATGVVIRPLDAVPGLLVSDGRRPRELRGLLRTAEQVIAGPDGRLWASRPARLDGGNTYTLVDTAGKIAGKTLSATGWFRTDGGTGLLLDDVSGVWQAYPGTLRRISIGAVVAVGPGHYQITECDDAHRCSDYLYDRSTGQRRRLGPATAVGYQAGTISPSGSHVALLQDSTDGVTVIKVERLADGTSVRSFAGPEQGYGGTEQYAVWLSDRWLAVVQRGRLVLYDPARNQVVSTDLPLAGALQLAWRAG